MNEKPKPIFCKDCKHYKGEVKYSVQYPMGIGHTWKYMCGLHDNSVFAINLKNDCRGFKPIPSKIRSKIGLIKKLKSWFHGQKRK